VKKTLTSSFLLLLAIALFSGTIDLDFLFNYADQDVPDYITQDNVGSNYITDEQATLGRVLFYDKHLSSNNTTACASCHLQEFAFGDTSLVSLGANGLTGRHSMRLVNARFSEESRFFWDERAATLEVQTTMPIRDHGEMGYSGTNGDPEFADLLDILNNLSYYDDLLYLSYGDTEMTEERMQEALAQFIRSIQSFDSKYDEGRALVANDTMDFPNFTPIENLGKNLFISDIEFDFDGNRIGGGAACASCHRAPEFDIDPLSRSNGVTMEISGDQNFSIHRSPSLRDLFNPFTGELNGPLMHNGNFDNLHSVMRHYSDLGENLSNVQIAQLDTRLRVGLNPQLLHLTQMEINAMSAFLRTLTGNDMYVNEKWSDPFDEFGNIEIIGSPLSVNEIYEVSLNVFPNPSSGIGHLDSGIYLVRISSSNNHQALKTLSKI